MNQFILTLAVQKEHSSDHMVKHHRYLLMKGGQKIFSPLLFHFKSILEAYYSFVFSHFSFLFFFSLLIGTFFILLFSFSLPFLFLLPLPHSLPLYFLSFSLFLIWTFWCLFSCLSSYFFKIILFYMNNN